MHIETISNGFGAPSMYMMVLAGQGEIPATISISADTGWERDCLLSTGERVTANQFYHDVIKPLGAEIGIETAFVRTIDQNGIPLPSIVDVLRQGKIPIPTYGSNGGQLPAACTDKWKVRAVRQELRKRGATTAQSALGMTMGETHRMKHDRARWHSAYYPLIERRLYRATIQNRLNALGVPYVVFSQCEGCPWQDAARWLRTAGWVIDELAEIEAGFGGTQFFSDRRIPLKAAIEQMTRERPISMFEEGSKQ